MHVVPTCIVEEERIEEVTTLPFEVTCIECSTQELPCHLVVIGNLPLAICGCKLVMANIAPLCHLELHQLHPFKLFHGDQHLFMLIH